MSTTSNSTTLSEVFCCVECHDRVALVVLPGGDLSYECVNPRCGKTVHSDAPEGLGMLGDYIELPDMVALAMGAPTPAQYVADARTPAEKRYDSLRDGSFYDVPFVPEQEDPRILIAREADAVLAALPVSKHIAIVQEEDAEVWTTGDELPFGTLRDGTPVVGVYDQNEPNGRAGIVHALIGDWLVTAQDTPNLLTLGPIQHAPLRFSEMTLADIQRVRAFFTSDVPEQLLAAAIAHGRGDAPAAPLADTLSHEGEQLGVIDGIPVYGVYERDAERMYAVEMTWKGKRLSTDGSSYVNIPTKCDLIGDFSFDQWEYVKALALTDVTERLISFGQVVIPPYNEEEELAQADTDFEMRVLPALAPVPALMEELHASSYVTAHDHYDPAEGDDRWITYTSGDVRLTHVLNDPTGVTHTLSIHRTPIDDQPITADLVGGIMVDIGYLLADDRVRVSLGLGTMHQLRHRKLAA